MRGSRPRYGRRLQERRRARSNMTWTSREQAGWPHPGQPGFAVQNAHNWPGSQFQRSWVDGPHDGFQPFSGIPSESAHGTFWNREPNTSRHAGNQVSSSARPAVTPVTNDWRLQNYSTPANSSNRYASNSVHTHASSSRAGLNHARSRSAGRPENSPDKVKPVKKKSKSTVNPEEEKRQREMKDKANKITTLLRKKKVSSHVKTNILKGLASSPEKPASIPVVRTLNRDMEFSSRDWQNIGSGELNSRNADGLLPELVEEEVQEVPASPRPDPELVALDDSESEESSSDDAAVEADPTSPPTAPSQYVRHLRFIYPDGGGGSGAPETPSIDVTSATVADSVASSPSTVSFAVMYPSRAADSVTVVSSPSESHSSLLAPSTSHSSCEPSCLTVGSLDVTTPNVVPSSVGHVTVPCSQSSAADYLPISVCSAPSSSISLPRLKSVVASSHPTLRRKIKPRVFRCSQKSTLCAASGIPKSFPSALRTILPKLASPNPSSSGESSAAQPQVSQPLLPSSTSMTVSASLSRLSKSCLPTITSNANIRAASAVADKPTALPAHITSYSLPAGTTLTSSLQVAMTAGNLTSGATRSVASVSSRIPSKRSVFVEPTLALSNQTATQTLSLSSPLVKPPCPPRVSVKSTLTSPSTFGSQLERTSSIPAVTVGTVPNLIPAPKSSKRRLPAQKASRLSSTIGVASAGGLSSVGGEIASVVPIGTLAASSMFPPVVTAPSHLSAEKRASPDKFSSSFDVAPRPLKRMRSVSECSVVAEPPTLADFRSPEHHQHLPEAVRNSLRALTQEPPSARSLAAAEPRSSRSRLAVADMVRRYRQLQSRRTEQSRFLLPMEDDLSPDRRRHSEPLDDDDVLPVESHPPSVNGSMLHRPASATGGNAPQSTQDRGSTAASTASATESATRPTEARAAFSGLSASGAGRQGSCVSTSERARSPPPIVSPFARPPAAVDPEPWLGSGPRPAAGAASGGFGVGWGGAGPRDAQGRRNMRRKTWECRSCFAQNWSNTLRIFRRHVTCLEKDVKHMAVYQSLQPPHWPNLFHLAGLEHQLLTQSDEMEDHMESLRIETRRIRTLARRLGLVRLEMMRRGQDINLTEPMMEEEVRVLLDDVLDITGRGEQPPAPSAAQMPSGHFTNGDCRIPPGDSAGSSPPAAGNPVVNGVQQEDAGVGVEVDQQEPAATDEQNRTATLLENGISANTSVRPDISPVVAGSLDTLVLPTTAPSTSAAETCPAVDETAAKSAVITALVKCEVPVVKREPVSTEMILPEVCIKLERIDSTLLAGLESNSTRLRVRSHSELHQTSSQLQTAEKSSNGDGLQGAVAGDEPVPPQQLAYLGQLDVSLDLFPQLLAMTKSGQQALLLRYGPENDPGASSTTGPSLLDDNTDTETVHEQKMVVVDSEGFSENFRPTDMGGISSLISQIEPVLVEFEAPSASSDAASEMLLNSVDSVASLVVCQDVLFVLTMKPDLFCLSLSRSKDDQVAGSCCLQISSLLKTPVSAGADSGGGVSLVVWSSVGGSSVVWALVGAASGQLLCIRLTAPAAGGTVQQSSCQCWSGPLHALSSGAPSPCGRRAQSGDSTTSMQEAGGERIHVPDDIRISAMVLDENVVYIAGHNFISAVPARVLTMWASCNSADPPWRHQTPSCYFRLTDSAIDSVVVINSSSAKLLLLANSDHSLQICRASNGVSLHSVTVYPFPSRGSAVMAQACAGSAAVMAGVTPYGSSPDGCPDDLYDETSCYVAVMAPQSDELCLSVAKLDAMAPVTALGSCAAGDPGPPDGQHVYAGLNDGSLAVMRLQSRNEPGSSGTAVRVRRRLKGRSVDAITSIVVLDRQVITGSQSGVVEAFPIR